MKTLQLRIYKLYPPAIILIPIHLRNPGILLDSLPSMKIQIISEVHRSMVKATNHKAHPAVKVVSQVSIT